MEVWWCSSWTSCFCKIESTNQMPLLRGLQPDQETQEISKDQRVSKRKSSVIHLWDAGLVGTILHNQSLQWDLVMKRKQGWGIIGLKINRGSWNSNLNFLEKSENSFSDGYGENSAAFQVESGVNFEWHRVSIYRGNGKEMMNKAVCMRLDNPCMGLHDHAQGPKTMPIASWTQMPKVWTCN